MLDILQVIFWSITYILINIAGYQNRDAKKTSIPYLAAAQNFSWEAVALIRSGGFWGHAVWLLLDAGILFFGFRFLHSLKKRCFFLAAILSLFLLFAGVFRLENGMLYSSFVIDFLMAVYYLIDRKKLSPKLKLPIAFTKLLGDTFAGLYYWRQSPFVAILAGLVLLCNLYYLYLCLEERDDAPKENPGQIK